eukprot:TRINITY_DN15478_c0_g1_i2.p2 TRINITY_DN15478_c0_g1~~TRINITY_DN15478_c0_g1_i2.p2  ORF type:complete len:150 (-),score=46.82 TRINITY_DN15478_c0_g1_i2:33-482(-)
MLGVNMSLEGMDALINKIELMGIKTNAVISPALKAAAEPVLNEAKGIAAFIDKTGNLRKAMKISNVKTIKGVKAVWVGDVDKQANYSWYVEFGHSKAQKKKKKKKKKLWVETKIQKKKKKAQKKQEQINQSQNKKKKKKKNTINTKYIE